MTSIFIQIPAYRDYELWNTVADAVTKASGKYKLAFGIHNCILENDKEDFSARPNVAEYAEIRYIESIAPQNIGLQLARMKANETYDGETYYLQTDSHMRFAKDWDVGFVNDVSWYKNMGITKPLLTCYPPDFQYDAESQKEVLGNPGVPTQISFHENPKQFVETLIPSQMAIPAIPQCGFTKSVSGGMIFTVGQFADITPNPKIAFWGEEPLIAARAFTHGFDIMLPTECRLWHLYASGNSFEKIRRHHVWADFPELWQQLDIESKSEYKRIFLERIVGRYALGTQRTLDEYEEFAGLNFRTGEIHGIK